MLKSPPFIKQRLRALLSLALVTAYAASAEGEERVFAPQIFSGSFATGFEQKLGTDGSSRSSFVFEPAIAARLSESQRLELNSFILRPSEPTLNFEAPRTSLTYWHGLSNLGDFKPRLYGAISALDLDRWKSDGHSLRQSGGAEISTSVFEKSRVTLRVGPFWQWNRYHQTAAGLDHPLYGAAQRLQWLWEPGDWVFDVRLFLTQSKAAVWRNDYGTYESVGYRLVPGATLSVAHELSTGLIDDTTGFSRSFRLFDRSESKLFLWLKLEI